MYRMLLLTLILVGVCNTPSNFAVAQTSDCVSMTTSKSSEHSCKNETSIFSALDKLPAYFSTVDNQCEQAVRVMLTMQQGSKTFVGYSEVSPKQQTQLIGCGDPRPVLGWCFVSEAQKGNCPDHLLRKMQQ